MSVQTQGDADTKIDKLFAVSAQERDFCFDKSVVDVFDDMISRSVPFYSTVLKTIADLAVDLACDGRRIYDVGCSLGTLSLAIARGLRTDSPVIGIDSSPEMIKAARSRAQECDLIDRVSYEIRDVTTQSEFTDACVAIFSLTLQFIRPLQRLPLLEKVRRSLHEGGAVLVFEKVVCPDPDFNRAFIAKYYDFKRANGYSEIEINQKRAALENVLIPFTIEENVEMLKNAGFSSVTTFFQWYNFAAFIARK